MATIRDIGKKKYKAEIVIRRGSGVKAFRLSRVFPRSSLASQWADEIEPKLRTPGGIERYEARQKSGRPTVGDLVRRYVDEVDKDYGRSKADYLRRLQKFEISDRIAEDLESQDYLEFMRMLSETRAKATVAGLFGTLTSVLEIAKAGWGIPINIGAIRDARFTANHLGYKGKSKQRTRRPSLDELDQLMELFITNYQNDKKNTPMHFIVAFALMSGRRQAEICRLRHSDVTDARVVVRDVKSPYGSTGNHKSLWMLPQAKAISEAHDRCVGADPFRLFPYHKDTVSRRFTEAVGALDIDDLHFHDLRHDCCSWLGETNWTPQQIMKITGHESLQQVDRYSQLEQLGDKYADWKWFEILENL